MMKNSSAHIALSFANLLKFNGIRLDPQKSEMVARA